MKNLFAISGILIGLCGAGIAIYQEEIAPQPTLSKKAADAVVKKTREIMGRPEVKKEYNWLKTTRFILGSIAILLGIISWYAKESLKLYPIVICLGLVAVAWEFVLAIMIIMSIGGIAAFGS